MTHRRKDANAKSRMRFPRKDEKHITYVGRSNERDERGSPTLTKWRGVKNSKWIQSIQGKW